MVIRKCRSPSRSFSKGYKVAVCMSSLFKSDRTFDFHFQRSALHPFLLDLNKKYQMDYSTSKQNLEGREGEKGKWASFVTKTLKSDCETVWKISSDFIGLNKYASFVDVCDHVEGEANAVGCVRSVKFQDKWAKEKLLAIDPRSYCYSYDVGDNNIGFVGYKATVQLQAVSEGTLVKWSFEADPSPAYSREEFIGMMSSLLQGCMEAIEVRASSDE